MKFKKTFCLLFGTVAVWAVPMVYPMQNIIVSDNAIEPMDNIIMPKCVVHPMGEEYDLNLDGVVDDVDILNVANAWNSKLLEQKYNQAYDFNKDNKIDIYDIMIIASKYGKSCDELYPKGKNR